ncbi:MAG TPA: AMP-binding protein [Candidatus Aminicenantes bacterium]|nr:AMP-binding protein [Candidatus Aminicenantes bacterium]HRY65635.1 AMP-binding protein [Candidatus Aminicenantes bacterium]HRZ72477.1 AMP-binding protein [Candidatus Aminicenantes bacterium]
MKRSSASSARGLLEKIERGLASGRGPGGSESRAFLRSSSDPAFLRELGTTELLDRWAEASFVLLQRTGYGLWDLFEDRLREAPDRVLFRDMALSPPRVWTYDAAGRHIRETAAALHLLADRDGREPRLAIYAENHPEGAFADLACLFYDILDTPLNPHFSLDNVVGIFDALDIGLALANDRERLGLLKEARRRTARPFQILVSDPALRNDGEVVFLPELCKRLGARDIDARLEKRRRFRPGEVATVMYTSGTTGRPKGVSFSIYNLIAKRFARAAALPAVGPDEVFLSFLPLYHTFGRYLEMLGAIFWRGTYAFAGNPSAETLFGLLPTVRPTGFISVPVRWAQLHEKCLERIDAAPPEADPTAIVREIVGPRLKWGLSAAGYLDPRVFRFFIAHGVELMSGFGMTEATGGITMTPPGGYIDGSHGLPLPGIRARLTPEGELQVSGHYVARYLEDKGPGDVIPFPGGAAGHDHWFSTGDVFERQANGYYQIIDRIKDIYKNNRGQTVAPRKVEDKFAGVPGIKRTFLVGDGRPYNVLFIVPDYRDRVLAEGLGRENAREYYRRIVTAANEGLAPYERVVNFDVLDRDFSAERGELTAKSSYNRKRIEASFAPVIDGLYRRRAVDLAGPGLRVRIPLWFFRDLGILEDEIVREPDGLKDLNRGLRLPLRRGADERFWLVGDLEYEIEGGILDLGLFARQPALWAGNPSLAAFAPVKEGWDLPLDTATGRISLPRRRARTYAAGEIAAPPKLGDAGLARLHARLSELLFSADEPPGTLLTEVERVFYESPLRTEELVRARLRALARHPREKLRCWAYRILLLFDPDIDYGQGGAAAFVRSGLPFLNRESMDEIVSASLGRGRLDAFRIRLRAYRETLPWPVDESGRQQFVRIFRLLADLGIREPSFFSPVRAELASWTLHRADPHLTVAAERELDRMILHYGRNAERLRGRAGAARPPRPTCDDSVTPAEARRIRAVLDLPGFLRDSIRLACGAESFEVSEIAPDGIWVSRIYNAPRRTTFRISVNTSAGRHYDLKLVLPEGRRDGAEHETRLWSAVLADQPGGPRVLPPLGATDERTGAVTWRHLGDLTVWEKIRESAGRRAADGPLPAPSLWRKLFVEAMSALFRAWQASGRRVLPGRISPVNVVVPELEFRDDTFLASIDGWRASAGPLSIVRPMIDGFYRRTSANYPWTRDLLDLDWIFDAAYDALGRDKASAFFADLQAALERTAAPLVPGEDLAVRLRRYRAEFDRSYAIPLPAESAVEAYQEWRQDHPLAPPRDRERKVLDLARRYALDRYPEIVRYYLYRHTYFAGRSEKIETLFDRLLARMNAALGEPAVQRVELSDLQSALHDERDLLVFSRMVFPRMEPDRRLDVVTQGEEGERRVIVQSFLQDRAGRTYTFNETVDPAEIGQNYRLFFKENYPKIVSQQDRHFVLKDAQERIVGGLCYRMLSNRVAWIDVIAVTSRLKSSGLGGAALEDFCGRMASQGVPLVMTHLYLPGFFLRHGFRLDKRWGALVKTL